jgi:hypothetical protein
MSTKLRAAVESTIEKRHAAGTAPLSALKSGLLLAAMMNLLNPPIMWRTIAGLQDQTFKPAGKRNRP